MKSHGMATDNLANVIQALQLVRKTGLLEVRRDGKDSMLEQGTITFRDGQMIDANVGLLRGADALQKLVSWRNCYFVFQSSPPPPSSSSTSPLPRVLPKNNGVSPKEDFEQELSGKDSSTFSVPYRVRQISETLPDFQRLGLSRAHRQLFLLIDGTRSVPELTRLLGRRQEEVVVMLNDLGVAGLIR